MMTICLKVMVLGKAIKYGLLVLGTAENLRLLAGVNLVISELLSRSPNIMKGTTFTVGGSYTYSYSPASPISFLFSLRLFFPLFSVSPFLLMLKAQRNNLKVVTFWCCSSPPIA